MPKTKKKFIDKKKAVTFNLVHRSQRDPLAADETAPQRVLVPVNTTIPPTKDKDPEYTPEQRKEEQRKYGIYYDDDYNYLQHLKDTKEVTLVLQPKTPHKKKPTESTKTDEIIDEDEEPPIPVTERLMLPSSVFASEFEEDVGLLNKAAPQGLRLDLDPEVVAALDEDFDFDDPENELEDNFIELAMGDDDEEAYDEDEGSSGDDNSEKAFSSDFESNDESDSQDEDNRGRMPTWAPPDKDDTKSRFSQYSMSSSIMRRNQGLELLDNRFEKMYAEYDDTELGALDLDEIEGHMPETHAMLLQAAQEFEASQRKYKLDKETEMRRLQRLQEIEEESEEDVVTVEVEPKERWDCETILSTYSNLYNHPKLIEEPKKPKRIVIDPKTGIPKDVLGADGGKLTVKALARFNAMSEAAPRAADVASRADTLLSTLSALSIRPTDESVEEKRERKRLLKEYRRERRIEKKANKEAFKEEKKRQEKIMMNNKNNVQGNRIL